MIDSITSSCSTFGSSTLLTSCITLKNENKTIIVNAIWDTGATNSCISRKAIEQLALLPKENRNFYSALNSEIKEVSMYKVDVIISKDIYYDKVLVAESNTEIQGFDFIIGMDIISQGDFVISNCNGKTTFAFRTPSEGFNDLNKF